MLPLKEQTQKTEENNSPRQRCEAGPMAEIRHTPEIGRDGLPLLRSRFQRARAKYQPANAGDVKEDYNQRCGFELAPGSWFWIRQARR